MREGQSLEKKLRGEEECGLSQETTKELGEEVKEFIEKEKQKRNSGVSRIVGSSLEERKEKIQEFKELFLNQEFDENVEREKTPEELEFIY